MLTPEKIAEMDKLTGLQQATSTSKRGIDRFAELEALDTTTPKSRSKILDVGIGAAKGLGSTAVNTANLISKGLQKAGVPEGTFVTPTQEDVVTTQEKLEPEGTAQKIGKGVEQVAEFLTPGLAGIKVAKAPGVANLTARAGTEALGSGGVTLAQTGDIDEAKTGAAIGAAFPVAGKTLDVIKNEKNAGRLINSLIKTKTADLSFGKNPGKTVAELGVVGNTLEGLAENIGTKKKEVGEKIGSLVKLATQQGKKIDLSSAFSTIEEAIKKAKKAELTNAPLITKLENLKTDLTKGKNLSNLTPEEAFQLKQDVAELTKFTGNPSDDKAANAALMDIYSNIRNKINTAVGGKDILKLNNDYGNLLTAEKAANKRNASLEGQNLLSLGGKTLAGGTALTTLLTGGAAMPAVAAGLGVLGIEKAISSPAVRTRLAKWMASRTPAERSELIKLAPYLKGIVITNSVED